MKKSLPFIALASLALAVSPAHAALEKGATAPAFVAKGAKAGKPITFDLAKALRKGPVVLYFFPAAFTPGCTLEAQSFAEAIPDFEAAGATVVGVTAGNVDQLADFSSKHCAGKFPVAAASEVMKVQYDVDLKKPDGTSAGVTDRTTYVIGRDGKIVLAFSDLNWNDHVAKSLAAVRALKAKS